MLRERWGARTALLSSGGELRQVVLEERPGAGHAGFALRVAGREPLARAVTRLRGAGVPLEAWDHGWCVAVVVHDPDGNEVALHAERPPARWPRRADGALHHHSAPADPDDLPAT